VAPRWLLLRSPGYREGMDMSQPQRKMTPQEESLWFKVRIALKVDPETVDLVKKIQIGVTRGIVTLEGAAPSAEVAQHAERIVLRIADVSGVVNKLTPES